MVTVKVQRYPIRDYFMAYLVEELQTGQDEQEQQHCPPAIVYGTTPNCRRSSLTIISEIIHGPLWNIELAYCITVLDLYKPQICRLKIIIQLGLAVFAILILAQP